ncbi:carbamoyltransferase HypF [Desulfocicer niacini]
MDINTRISARHIDITGVVQGVGFRPFVYQLARYYGLNGQVSNTGQGVRLLVEGPEEKIAAFSRDISEKAPPLSSITALQSRLSPVQGFDDFTICMSSGAGQRRALISADVSVCTHCLAEMHDSANRRFAYPFINCTHCGPRYTIIKDIPYDRAKTAMAGFSLCPDCQKEYDDPLDRRFHAQPNACPVCGPRVFLVDARKNCVDNDPGDALKKAALMLKKGHIVAVKGLGGFHLAVDASCHDAVTRLRTAKKRPDKPFALMARTLSYAARHVHISPEEETLLMSRHRPIVLLRKRFFAREKDSKSLTGTQVLGKLDDQDFLSDAIAPGNPLLGIMLPYTPLHYLLLEQGPPVLVMTSGNPSGEPLSIDNDKAFTDFSHMADYFLFHNRDIYFRADDSILQVQEKIPRFLRRSRGYAPLPVFLKNPLPQVLACGGGVKSTVCLTREDKAFLSQHIGDLDNEKVFEFYRSTVDHLKKILDIRPGIIAHDLHSGYLSTTWALAQEDVTKVAVQHHHAHAVSCMAENHVLDPVIAITLDGTGLGTDGSIWGGEVLTCTLTDFKRCAHLKYTPMPGGDAAVREPWRMAAAHLWQVWGDDFVDLDLPLIHRVGQDRLRFVATMMKRKINSPLTSSCGRLFDAVASLCGIRDNMTFEGQAAMDLQAVSQRNEQRAYAMDFKEIHDEEGNTLVEMDTRPAMMEMVEDVQKGLAPGEIGTRFHETIVRGFTHVALGVSDETGIDKVVLTGGVFNNGIIVSGLLKRLEHHGLRVYTHTRVPAGDGGISLGQAVIAGSVAR